MRKSPRQQSPLRHHPRLKKNYKAPINKIKKLSDNCFSYYWPARLLSAGSECLRNLLLLDFIESLITWMGTFMSSMRGRFFMNSRRTQLGIVCVDGFRNCKLITIVVRMKPTAMRIILSIRYLKNASAWKHLQYCCSWSLCISPSEQWNCFRGGWNNFNDQGKVEDVRY